MKKLSYSLIGLSFIATAAYAQSADPTGALPPQDGAVPGQADPAVPPPPEPAVPAPQDAIPPEPVPADAIPPAPDASADAAVTADASFTDAEIDSFAKATVEVQKIDGDASLDAAAKQEQMAAAVTEAGLDPAKYNEIGQALATDTELRAKVQTAMAKHAGGSAG